MVYRLAPMAAVRYVLAMNQIPIVDTHQHLWDLDLLNLPWLGEAPQLARHHRIDDYLREVAGHGVAKAVYMEVDVAPDDRPRERELITALCRDPGAPTSGAVFGATPGSVEFPATVDALAANPYAKGARLVLHPPNLPGDYCLRDAFVDDVRKLGANGLLFDICIRPTDLASAAELARRCAGMTFILDHCGNADPHIVAGNGGNPDDPVYGHTREQWLEGMQTVGALPNVVCKISGIVARAARPAGPPPTWPRRSTTVSTASAKTASCSAATGRCAPSGRPSASGSPPCARSSAPAPNASSTSSCTKTPNASTNSRSCRWSYHTENPQLASRVVGRR